MVQVWRMPDNNEVSSQSARNYVEDFPVERLTSEIGVNHYSINVDDLENDPVLREIKRTMGITYEDCITINREAMPNFDEKLTIFYTEHLHADDEIRLVVDGSGYFDIRDKDDKWVRIAVAKGDLITLPAGSYHRFTTDEKESIVARRFFVGDPIWTPLNRPSDDHAIRVEYLKKYLK